MAASDSFTESFIADICPFSVHSFQDYFNERSGGFILINVGYQGVQTTAFVNIVSPTSASWRSIAN